MVWLKMGSFLEGHFVFCSRGAAPEKWMIEAGEYTMSRFAKLYGMEYAGMATNQREADELGRKI